VNGNFREVDLGEITTVRVIFPHAFCYVPSSMLTCFPNRFQDSSPLAPAMLEEFPCFPIRSIQERLDYWFGFYFFLQNDSDLIILISGDL